jgi:hypothetical protein
VTKLALIQIKGSDKVTRGGELEPIKILLQEPTYVPTSNSKAKTLQEGDEHTNQQRRQDPLEVTNTVEKE